LREETTQAVRCCGFEDLLEWSGLDDRPVIHENDSDRRRSGGLHFVRDDHRRRAVLTEIGDEYEDAPYQFRVQRRSGLVAENITWGDIANARAIATRCCCPRASVPGRASPRPAPCRPS
jgi:hypothetical protein